MVYLMVGFESVGGYPDVASAIRESRNFLNSQHQVLVADKDLGVKAIYTGDEWVVCEDGSEYVSRLSEKEMVVARVMMPKTHAQFRRGILYGYEFDRIVRESIRTGNFEE